MTPTFYWINRSTGFRLGAMARPRGGDWLEDEIACLVQAGINTVVSLLERQEIEELDLQAEPDLCRRHHIDYFWLPIPDRGTPASLAEAASAIQVLAESVIAGKCVVVHCRQGIGRSGIIAACVLKACGLDSETALKLVSSARGCRVPETEAQRDWLVKFSRSI